MECFFSNGGSSFVSYSGVMMGGGGRNPQVYEDRDGEVITGSNVTCRRVRNCTITGSNAKVDDATNCTITGSNAKVTKARGCRVTGSHVYVEGDDNIVVGSNAEAIGKNNQVSGINATNNGESVSSEGDVVINSGGMVIGGGDISSYSNGNYTKMVCNSYTVETWVGDGKTQRRVTYPDGHVEQKEYDGHPPPIFF